MLVSETRNREKAITPFKLKKTIVLLFLLNFLKSLNSLFFIVRVTEP